MKKSDNPGSIAGRELFKPSELESMAPRPSAASSRSWTSSRGAAALDLLMSRAKSPCREIGLFESEGLRAASEPGYRFNFCGGIVR